MLPHMQYVPLPVVGGYLGFVGYFCLAAGVSQACNVEVRNVLLFAGVSALCNARVFVPRYSSCTGLSTAPESKGTQCAAQVDSFPSWANLGTRDALTKFAAALGTTLLLLATLKFGRNPLLLPAVLLAVPAAFHVALAAAGTSLQQAADAGWTMQPEVGSARPSVTAPGSARVLVVTLRSTPAPAPCGVPSMHPGILMLLLFSPPRMLLSSFCQQLHLQLVVGCCRSRAGLTQHNLCRTMFQMQLPLSARPASLSRAFPGSAMCADERLRRRERHCVPSQAKKTRCMQQL